MRLTISGVCVTTSFAKDSSSSPVIRSTSMVFFFGFAQEIYVIERLGKRAAQCFDVILGRVRRGHCRP